ncbi:MAG: PIN domain-containing protein [Acidobacteriia bacterium]|nr:PIN domain-containing protein [Terriglobia bacterium]
MAGKFLIDTHVWIWHVMGDARLEAAHKRILQDRNNEFWLSSISIWEILLLLEKKKLKVNTSPSVWLERAFEAFPVREAALTFKIAARSRELTLPHADPADRFIAATAAEMKIPLLTVDENLISCPDIICR